MGSIQPVRPVLLIAAVFSRHQEVIAQAKALLEERLGPLALQSEPFAFDQTDYYTASMGPGLRKQFFAFRELIDPGKLPSLKLQTNRWEEELAASGRYEESRVVNIDPGYLNLSKLVLASTKDHAHRIYLGKGIYAEVTLHYKRETGWTPWPWTYPDYRRGEYHAFFDRCRQYYRQRVQRRG